MLTKDNEAWGPILGLPILGLWAFLNWSYQPAPRLTEVGRPQQKEAPAAQAASRQLQGTEQFPLIVKVLPAAEAQNKTDGHRDEGQEKAADDRSLVFATYILAAIGFLQLLVFSWQGFQLKRTVDSSERTSYPILSPFIVGLDGLHPMEPTGDRMKFEAYVPLVFENFGKTSAHVRQVKAGLFLTDFDGFPPLDFDVLEEHEYSRLIAGETRGQAAMTAVVEVRKEFDLSPEDFAKLLAPGTTPYKRFCMLGLVVYDDPFGLRHTRYFCIKMRKVPPHGANFHTFRGGPRYNHFTRTKVPKSDPFD